MYPPGGMYSGGTYSADGRWYWNGQAWVPAPPPLPNPGGMFWFFSSPDWIGPLLLNGLILLIPFVGTMVVYGWYLTTRDNIRQGRWQVAPVSFGYLERGLRPWVVLLVYQLILLIVPLLLAIGAVAAMVSDPNSALAWAVLFGAVGVGIVYLVLVFLAEVFLFAAIFDLSDSRGIGFALSPGRIWEAAKADSSRSWRAGGAYVLGALVVSVIPYIGFILLPGAFLMACPAQAEFNGSANVS